MTDTSGSEKPPARTPSSIAKLPFAEELLSERSRAWVQDQRSDTAGAPPQIAGYTILHRVGQGGMGTVYECRREGSDARLAIKIISSGKYASDEERRRFMAEIAALLRLHHPHLCRLRDFGQDAQVSWFVMDFIDGRPFHVWQEQDRPTWTRIADLLAQASRAVAYAHRQGIIHRDLNPANLMVRSDGTPVIMDFGLARDLASDELLTLAGTTVGTPPYMAPEQTQGIRGTITVRSDVWGMGGVLYRALTGRPPFEGSSTHDIFTAINDSEVVRPRAHAKDAPAVLERIALRCLQRDPADRYHDLDALAADLESFAAGQRVVVRLPGLVGSIQRRARRHPLPWALGAALILLTLGFLGYAAVEQIRRWATWTKVVDATLGNGPLPPGIHARDGLLQQLASSPAADATGLPRVEATYKSKLVSGWWWFESPGLRGGSRLELEFELPVKDTIELVIDAPPTTPDDWWHHPAGWALKISATEELMVAVTYLQRPGAVPSSIGYLLNRPSGPTLHLMVEVVDTRLTIGIAGNEPVVVDEPLALGGTEHRGIGLRWFGEQTRLKQLRIERLAKAELVSPLLGPDSLLRHGQRDAALAEYRLIALDHQRTALGTKALLRAYAVSALYGDADDSSQEAIYKQIRLQEDPRVAAQAGIIRAKALWSRGEYSRALGVVRDPVAQWPDLNPIQGFLADRTWQADRPCGDDVLRLLAIAPSIGSLTLPDLGITELSPIAGRRAYTVVISNNRISDLGPLSASGCTYLAAQRNRIADLAPLGGLTSLTSLNLADNQISELRPLAGLHQLRILQLGSNNISSLAGLPGNIQELTLGTDPGQVDHLRNLNQSEPRLGGNPLASLTGLPVKELRLLSLARTAVMDLTLLAAAKQLARLDLSATPVRDLSPVRGLPIVDLGLSECQGVDLTTLDLPELLHLVMRRLPVADVTVLADPLKRLTSLDATGCRITGWPALPAPVLTDLNLSGCPLEHLDGLGAAPGLKTLTLRSCGLRQLPPALDGLLLDRLDLRDNALADLGTLLQRPPTVLLVTGNPLTDAACDELIATGRRLGRPELAWQGASILCERRGDLQPLRRVAMVQDDRQVAILFTSRPITEEEAKRMAAASGARLAVIGNAAANQLVAKTIDDQPVWLGVSLREGIVVDEDGKRTPFTAQMPMMRYRGYNSLPRDGGRLAMAIGGNWTICLDGKAWGMVVQWDPDW